MKYRLLVVILSAIALVYAGSAGAQPVGVTWYPVFPGARAASMGSADIAGGIGPDAIYLNAAPLSDDVDMAFSYDWRNYHESSDLWNIAGAGRLGRWRLAVASTSVGVPNYYDQSDFDPTYPSELIEFKERTIMGGAAYDLGPELFAGPGTALVVGATLRRIDSRLGDWTTGATGLDLGTTLGSTITSAGSRRRIALAVTTFNILDAELDGDAEGEKLPKWTRVGATFTWSRLKGEDADASYEVTGAAGYDFREWTDNTWMVGMELVLSGTLYGRWGHNQALTDKSDATSAFTWGLGLSLDKFIGDNTDLSIDWGRGRDVDLAGQGMTVDMWSIRGGFRFD